MARDRVKAEILATMNGKPARMAEIARGVGRDGRDGTVRSALQDLVAEDLLARDVSGACAQ
jgi:hypothetical protein